MITTGTFCDTLLNVAGTDAAGEQQLGAARRRSQAIGEPSGKLETANHLLSQIEHHLAKHLLALRDPLQPVVLVGYYQGIYVLGARLT